MEHLYLHVPFCARRCAYCDFAIAVRTSVPGAAFVEAIEHEYADTVRERRVEIRPLKTVYVGGGTPSRLAPDDLGRLLRWVRRVGRVGDDAELTLEANPEDVTPHRVAAWLRSGITRVSLGVQSMADEALGWMHRTHDATTARRALDLLTQSEIRSVSADLIFGLPDTIPNDPIDTLDKILAGGADHISAYGLTVEGGTPLKKWSDRGLPVAAPPARYAEEFLAIHDRLAQAGFDHYEVSNYAKPGAESRHNQAYWTGAAYLGLGPSAHSYDGQVRWWNARHWADYAKRVRSGVSVVEGSERLSPAQRELETNYLGLRTRVGIRGTAGDAVDQAVARGWLRRDAGRLVATPAGWLRLDELVVGLTT